MPELTIGIDLASLRQPPKQALATAASLGASGVVLDARGPFRPTEWSRTGLRQLRKQLDDSNLRVSAVAFPTRRGYDVLEDLDRRVEATKAALSFAHDVGARVVLNHLGQVPVDSEHPSWRTLLEVLADLGRHGERCGALLAAKTGSQSGEQLAALLDELTTGMVGVDLDPGGLIVNGHSAIDAAEALGSRVLHVTVSDAVRDLSVGRGLETQLGRGTADFPAILGALEEHNYRGWFSIRRGPCEDPAQEIGDAVQFLRSI
jgi:sugar phosphate isomerase/epimerase